MSPFFEVLRGQNLGDDRRVNERELNAVITRPSIDPTQLEFDDHSLIK
jgi:uncharacterized protein (DUF1697 family)